MKELVFVHGRSQQGRVPAELKQEWIAGLERGFAKIGKTLPIPESAIHLPFYGNALDDLVHDVTQSDAASVIAQGAGTEEAPDHYAADAAEMIREIAAANSIQTIHEEDLTEQDLAGDTVYVQQGAENWRITLALLRALDKVPGINAGAVALATRDVFRYLRQSGVSIPINKGVMDILQPGTETVVVSHSLGTVVCYNLLRTPGTNFKITQFVTLGSPLAITPIKRALAPLGWPQAVIGKWFNARDPRDVVALFPLIPKKFPAQPITDKSTVENRHDDPHSIEDYLGDPDVARCIYDALF
jgi:hypothetical protein